MDKPYVGQGLFNKKKSSTFGKLNFLIDQRNNLCQMRFVVFYHQI